MRSILLTPIWLLAVGYSQVPTFWFLAHPLAERWRAGRRPYTILVPVWLAEMLLAAAITWPWRLVTLYDNPWTWLPAGLLAILAAFLYNAAHRGFTHAQLVGRSELEAAKEQRLVTGGIRDRVRHPVYLAHLVSLAALAVGSGLLVNFCLLAYALLAFAITIPAEDAELERRFGDAYRDYRRRVPALIPRLRQSSSLSS